MTDPDLTGFLLARLSEDEQAARAVEDNSAPWTGQWVAQAGGLRTYNGWVLLYRQSGQPAFRPGLLDHIARHDPARVLAEVEVKRRIVDRYDHASRERRRLGET